jgi:hypothetical protein
MFDVEIKNRGRHQKPMWWVFECPDGGPTLVADARGPQWR